MNPMNADSVETQTLNRDAGDHSLSSSAHDGKNEVEDFMSLGLELNQ